MSPALTTLQRLKCHTFLQLYGVANKRHQRALAQAMPGAAVNWSAEGLKRLYLSCRGGLPFHNNYPVVLCDDPQAKSIVERAACLIVAALALHAEIREGTLTVETEGGVPLEMDQYRTCFSTYRIPQPVCDRHMSHADSSHIAVLVAGRVYKIAIAVDKRSVALEDINLALARILKDVGHTRDTNDNPEPCMFTALPREYWARTREMMQQDEQNRQLLRVLNEALVVVCLDIHCAPATLAETLGLLRDGNAQNRYYDKAAQIVVFQNGKAGLCFEHAAVDGSVALGFAGQLQRRAHALHETYSFRSGSRKDEPVAIEQLEWGIDARLRARLSFAQQYVLEKLGQRNLFAGSSSLGGRKRLQCNGLSPDATIQMAIQLAVNRLLSKGLNVLEPVQIRRFAGGRLEFVRTVTPESWAFVEAVQSGLNGGLVAQRLHAAVRAHRDLIAQSKAGQGVMAHLLALSAVEFPNDPVKGVHVQTRRQKLLAFLDQGLNLIINHDVMAANGSGVPEIAAFGTITSKPDSLGIGYVIENDAVVFDVRADGRYRERCSGLIAGIDDCLRTLSEMTKDSSGAQS